MKGKVETRVDSLKSLIQLPDVTQVKMSSYPIDENRTIYTVDVETEGD